MNLQGRLQVFLPTWKWNKISKIKFYNFYFEFKAHISPYKGDDNKNGTGYGNGTNVNLYFFDIIYYLAVVISFKYDINIY